MYFMAKAVRYILGVIPPDPTSFNPKDIKGLLDMGRHFLNLSQDQLYVLAKLMTMSAADFVEQWFESEPLKATLSASGIIGTFLGPRSPGTAYVLLHHYMGEIDGAYRAWGFHKGGTGGLAQVLARAAEAQGAEIRCNTGVAQVLVKGGRTSGVVLENGDEIHAPLVLSSLDPKQTFLNLVDPNQLPDDLVGAIRRFQTFGSSGKVNLALDRAPELASRPGIGRHLAGAISMSPNLDLSLIHI